MWNFIKKILPVAIPLIAVVWGGYIYYGVYELGLFKAIYSTMALFFANIQTASNLGIVPVPTEWYKNIFIPGVIALFVLSWAVLSLYTRLVGNSFTRIKKIYIGKHIVVIGLGEGNRAYIDSEILEGNSVIVIEADRDNPFIGQYRKKALVELADASQVDVLESLNVAQKEHVVISTGKDIDNINIAKEILNLNRNAKLFIQLNDRSLRDFHKEREVLSGSNVKVFSYYEESARVLFSSYDDVQNHDIDGKDSSIIQSDEPYAIAIVGDTILAHEVIAQACIMGQLPNENKLTIYCIDKDIKGFKNSMELEFPSILDVPNVTLVYKKADPKSMKFYKLDIWQEQNLTHIILCNENDQANLDIAANLTNVQYLEASVDKTMKCKMHIAMSESTILGKDIDDNSELFDHMYIFAQTKKVSDKKYIVDEKRDAQAIATNNIYDNISGDLQEYSKYDYDFKAKEGRQFTYDNSIYMDFSKGEWDSKPYFKKESSRAVADHMKTKLKYLGLRIISVVETDIDKNTLFIDNKKIFEEKLKNELVKLGRCEHNRWMTFHYLNGFKSMEFISNEDKDKREVELENKKIHMCLVPFDTFKQRSENLEALGFPKGKFEGNDFAIVKHIPQILTYGGYQLVELGDA